MLARRLFERVFAVVGDIDFEPLFHEGVRNEVGNGLLVVDDEDRGGFFGHGCRSFRAGVVRGCNCARSAT